MAVLALNNSGVINTYLLVIQRLWRASTELPMLLTSDFAQENDVQ